MKLLEGFMIFNVYTLVLMLLKQSSYGRKYVVLPMGKRHDNPFLCLERLPVPEIRLLHQNEEFELECYVNTTYINFTHFLVKWTWDGGKQKEIFDLSENLEIMTLSASLVQKIGSMVYSV